MIGKTAIAMVIELGRAMEPLPDALKVPATKVEGCASQVWLHPQIDAGAVHFDGEFGRNDREWSDRGVAQAV